MRNRGKTSSAVPGLAWSQYGRRWGIYLLPGRSGLKQIYDQNLRGWSCEVQPDIYLGKERWSLSKRCHPRLLTGSKHTLLPCSWHAIRINSSSPSVHSNFNNRSLATLSMDIMFSSHLRLHFIRVRSGNSFAYGANATMAKDFPSSARRPFTYLEHRSPCNLQMPNTFVIDKRSHGQCCPTLPSSFDMKRLAIDHAFPFGVEAQRVAEDVSRSVDSVKWVL